MRKIIAQAKIWPLGSAQIAGLGKPTLYIISLFLRGGRAHPNDRGTLGVLGFDAPVPAVAPGQTHIDYCKSLKITDTIFWPGCIPMPGEHTRLACGGRRPRRPHLYPTGISMRPPCSNSIYSCNNRTGRCINTIRTLGMKNLRTRSGRFFGEMNDWPSYNHSWTKRPS